MIFLDIKLLTENCAKISVSAEECRELGINYESFSPENLTAQLFLASVLARLEGEGMAAGLSDKITAEIFEQEDRGLIIYVSGSVKLKPSSERRDEPHESALILRTPAEVISAAKSIGKCGDARLYKIGGKYALIGTGIGGGLSPIETAKIKEYGKLLSDTPIDILSEL